MVAVMTHNDTTWQKQHHITQNSFEMFVMIANASDCYRQQHMTQDPLVMLVMIDSADRGDRHMLQGITHDSSCLTVAVT